ncbi:MAG: LemA family protein [Phycisphaerales bacterium JB037]
MGWIIGGIVLAVLFLIVVWLIAIYNGLVRKRVDCDNGWAQIDVQLKRRYDLIPNLVETVKGYASHERETLEAVIQARQHAVNITSDAMHAAAKADAEGALSSALSRLMAVAEAYPDLKANQNFAQLQEELTSTENKIGFARQHYNDTVGRYEETRQSFPTVIVAGMFNFDKREYFTLEDQTQREAPKVSF